MALFNFDFEDIRYSDNNKYSEISKIEEKYNKLREENSEKNNLQYTKITDWKYRWLFDESDDNIIDDIKMFCKNTSDALYNLGLDMKNAQDSYYNQLYDYSDIINYISYVFYTKSMLTFETIYERITKNDNEAEEDSYLLNIDHINISELMSILKEITKIIKITNYIIKLCNANNDYEHQIEYLIVDDNANIVMSNLASILYSEEEGEVEDFREILQKL